VSFLCKTLDIVKEENPNRTILARLDSGFESDEVMKLLECCGLGYLITMRGTYSVRSTLFRVGPKAWRRVPFEDEGEIEVGEFSIERGSSSKRLGTRFRIATLRRRFIAIAGRLVRDTDRPVLGLVSHTPLGSLALARTLRA